MSEEDEVKMATKESPFNLRFGQSRATHQPSKIKSESMKIGIKLNKAASEVVKNKNKLILENKKIQKVFVDMMTQHNRLYKKWRTADLISAIFALFGLLIAIAEFEIGSDFSNNDSNDRANLNALRIILRLIVVITSIVSAITIIVRYNYKRKWQNLPIPIELQNQVYNNDYTNVMRHSRRK